MGTSRSPPPLFLNSTNFLWKIDENHDLYMGLFRFASNILVLSLISGSLTCCEAHNSLSTFDVLDYGAVGDGCTNDTLAFVETWKNTCNAETEIAAMLVPDSNTFLVHPMTFDGPCKPTTISFLISGIIIAPDSPEAWKGRNQGRWLIFKGVDGLSVDGAGMIDGRGKGWWDILCATHRDLPGCVKLAPTVLSFLQCNRVSMSNMLVVDSPQTHILITGCNNVVIRYLSIKSPETSPNTDGIHISSSHGVFISNTNIGSGDDCVSIGDHTSNIYITDVYCGPGHGVSIGSLGKSGNEVKVDNINVIRVRFNKTTNGVRIKTWQVGRGYVRGVLYEDINFMDVKNPIIIDQYYCDVRGRCQSTKTGVQISDVRYVGIFGTSKSKVAINLNCSQAVPCTKIFLDTILLAPSTLGKKVISSCNNAYGSSAGIVEPKSCFLE